MNKETEEKMLNLDLEIQVLSANPTYQEYKKVASLIQAGQQIENMLRKKVKQYTILEQYNKQDDVKRQQQIEAIRKKKRQLEEELAMIDAGETKDITDKYFEKAKDDDDIPNDDLIISDVEEEDNVVDELPPLPPKTVQTKKQKFPLKASNPPQKTASTKEMETKEAFDYKGEDIGIGEDLNLDFTDEED